MNGQLGIKYCQQITMNRQPWIVNRQPSTVHRQPSTVDRQQSTVNRQQSTINRRSWTINRKPSTVNRQPPTVNRDVEKLPCCSGLIYTCSVCGQTFKRSHHLDQHHRAVHVKIKVPCAACGRKVIKRNLKRHQERYRWPEDRKTTCPQNMLSE